MGWLFERIYTTSDLANLITLQHSPTNADVGQCDVNALLLYFNEGDLGFDINWECIN